VGDKRVSRFFDWSMKYDQEQMTIFLFVCIPTKTNGIAFTLKNGFKNGSIEKKTIEQFKMPRIKI
jgi:hypothetical protein